MRVLHTSDWHIGKRLNGRDRLEELQAGATVWQKTLFSLPTLAESISKLAEKKLKF